MIVQHNITAMNANRMLGLTTGSLAKSTEKLSSGYRINRAADDAAGLTISEKMRKQIRGLDQASTNAEDGVSAVQTAEGALTEVHSMLQRMNELAVQASNGTMSADDRQAVQDEIDKLVDEADRVAETTKFNETYLLKGNPESKTTTYEAKYKNPLKNTVSQIANKDTYATGDSNTLTAADIDKYVEVDETGKLKYKEGKVLYKVAGTPGTAVGQQDQANRIAEADLDQYFKSETNGVYLDAAMKTVASDEDIKNAFDSTTGEYKTKLYQKTGPTDTTASEIGADYIDKYVNVTATAAIDIIGKAISEVSSQRSALGAVQNLSLIHISEPTRRS